MMISVERLQAYLRHSAQQQYDAVPIPPFTLFFHPTADVIYFNYAIPDEPPVDDLGPALAKLRAAFFARGRQPRFEFIEAFTPELPAALRAAGFVEEARQHLMVCTPETYQSAPTVPGLTITKLEATSTPDEAQAFLTAQRQGFAPSTAEPATIAAAIQFLHTLGGNQAFVARLGGAAVAAGMFTAPFDGLTEITGLATREPFRRRGIASALTAYAAHTAFDQGVELVFLVAADERAGRVYERVGFHPYTTMLAYSVLLPTPE